MVNMMANGIRVKDVELFGVERHMRIGGRMSKALGSSVGMEDF